MQATSSCSIFQWWSLNIDQAVKPKSFYELPLYGNDCNLILRAASNQWHHCQPHCWHTGTPWVFFPLRSHIHHRFISSHPQLLRLLPAGHSAFDHSHVQTFWRHVELSKLFKTHRAGVELVTTFRRVWQQHRKENQCLWWLLTSSMLLTEYTLDFNLISFALKSCWAPFNASLRANERTSPANRSPRNWRGRLYTVSHFWGLHLPSLMTWGPQKQTIELIGTLLFLIHASQHNHWDYQCYLVWILFESCLDYDCPLRSS